MVRTLVSHPHILTEQDYSDSPAAPRGGWDGRSPEGPGAAEDRYAERPPPPPAGDVDMPDARDRRDDRDFDRRDDRDGGRSGGPGGPGGFERRP